MEGLPNDMGYLEWEGIHLVDSSSSSSSPDKIKFKIKRNVIFFKFQEKDVTKLNELIGGDEREWEHHLTRDKPKGQKLNSPVMWHWHLHTQPNLRSS